MPNHIWALWLIAALAFIVIEILTPTFFVICFSVGALAAMLVSLISHGRALGAQLLTFSIFSLAAFIYLRIITRAPSRKKPRVLTNAEALIGQTAIVTKDIGLSHNEGEVRIRGDFWRAATADGKRHLRDEIVTIDRIDGTLLFVRSVDKQEVTSWAE